MNDLAIAIEKINISFNGVKVLHEVDFSIRKGEVHALIGTNGAGKSTLVKIINGVYKKDSGDIYLFGEKSDFNSPEQAFKAGIAMVFQDLSLIPTLTVSENIFLKYNPYRNGVLIDDRKNAAQTRELLSKIGIEAEIHPNDLVGSLSVGHQQLVEIAKALSSSPKILILDEPTASLTNAEIERFFGVINSLKNQGISIIYITHYLQDIFKICDSVTLLRDGRVAFTKRTADITLEYLVSNMTSQGDTANPWSRQSDIRRGAPVIEARNISTKYITDVSVSAYAGEVVGIAGLLGSGRTEFLRALFGIDRVRSGEILIDGKRVNLHDSNDAIRHGISLVPENRREQGLILDYTVAENTVMSIYGKIKKGLLFIDEKIKNRIAQEYVDKFAVKTQGIGQVIRYLSGGNQQKIVVAKCLANDSKILLLDDPTFGVDIQAKREIMKIIRDFASRGNVVFMVSSEFNELAEFCDSIYIMKKGRITDLITEKTTEDHLLYSAQ